MVNYKSRGGWTSIIIKKADQTKTTDVVTEDDTEISLPLAVGTHVFEAIILMESDATADFKYTFAFSGTATNSRWQNHIMASAENDLATDIAYTYAGTYPISIRVHGFLIVTALGNLTLQWSQNTSDAFSTKVLKGSIMQSRKVA